MTEVDDGAGERTVIQLASWDDRFWAWLIDVILVGAVVSVFSEGVSGLPFGLSFTLPTVGASGAALWLYWTVLEGTRGQSAGKLVMDVAVADHGGGEISYVQAAVESFGKAFLLPLDALIGWIAMEGEYLRLFNRLSNTIVVERPDDDRIPPGVEYVPPEG
ncbi:hypothetical protein JCM30237_06280 [Halolamina litorea]|uniref:RDD family protein n=1 Tax=Halolamina litorea TaxID=1515593 RepID=A0ABD6BPJ3_9EURY|nr:RDD family protein [Halolamina litorea]